jgi:hypothetical protein
MLRKWHRTWRGKAETSSLPFRASYESFCCRPSPFARRSHLRMTFETPRAHAHTLGLVLAVLVGVADERGRHVATVRAPPRVDRSRRPTPQGGGADPHGLPRPDGAAPAERRSRPSAERSPVGVRVAGRRAAGTSRGADDLARAGSSHHRAVGARRPKRTRVVIPRSQARPGYIAGFSNSSGLTLTQRSCARERLPGAGSSW